MQVAIMNDCDALDIRDFEAIREPWDNAGIPIDWSFFPYDYMGECKHKRDTEIFKTWGRTYDDHIIFSLENEAVRNYLESGLLQTIHMGIAQVLEYYFELSELVKQIREPILTGHGRPHEDNLMLWSNFLDKNQLSHKFFAISNTGIVHVKEDTSIVTGKTFKRIPPRAKSKQMPHYKRLINQLIRANGQHVILSTHFAHKYSEKNREEYLLHVRKTINYMDARNIQVIDVRKFIKLRREERKSHDLWT